MTIDWSKYPALDSYMQAAALTRDVSVFSELYRLLDSTRREERERCARVCALVAHDGCTIAAEDAAAQCAAAILALADEETSESRVHLVTNPKTGEQTYARK